MFNDHLSSEEAGERIKERMDEVETYSLHNRLGLADYGASRWIFAFIVLAAVTTIGLLL